MYLSYATILVFVGEYRILCKEVQIYYLVSDNQNPTNHPIYAIQEDMGSCILHLDDDTTCILQVEKYHTIQHKMDI